MRGQVTLFNHELRQIITDAMRIGRKMERIEQGSEPAFISMRHAQRVYGKGNVLNWIKLRVVTPVKDGENSSTIRLSVEELIIASTTSNRSQYFLEKEKADAETPAL